MNAARAGSRATHVRYLILLILFVITSISYADRATLSMTGPAISRELGMSPVAIGYALSSFAFAYVLAQVPGGVLLDRWGSKPVYIAALSLWSLFTLLQGAAGLLTGFAAAATLIGLRTLMGAAEAPCFPANARIVATWFPTSERATASAVFNAAQYFSLVAFAPLMGWLVHDFGWPAVFYVMGLLGVGAALVFAWYVQSPRRHPAANAAEIALIEQGGGLVDMEDGPRAGPSQFTWHNVRQVLANRSLIGIYLGQYCINVLTYFFATWFPIYLVQQRHMTILQAGFVAAVPALFGFAGGVLGGVLSDWLLRRTGSLTFARKAPLLVGMLLAMTIVLANYVDDQVTVIVVMTIAFFGKGVASLGWAVIADSSPRELLGVTGGIFNMAGNTAGIVMPIVVGYIVQATGSFDGALIFVGAHCLVTIFAYFAITQRIERIELRPAAATA
ncbi:MFS transporter [Sphingomonas sp. dw_22]|uniref:MFS transporter n=1 Tax=Sphingomonas sp. dw_22 TaxID=2721175 RepID=UPI001BD4F535|nr:MFS transporter [Sphingomonas sp. dw_22]